MSMNKTLLALALGISLSACSPTVPTKEVTVHQRIEQACESAGAAYKAIAAVNALVPLKASQQAKVLKAVAITDQRCKLKPGEDYPYTMSDLLLSELEGAAATLDTIKGEAQ